MIINSGSAIGDADVDIDNVKVDDCFAFCILHFDGWEYPQRSSQIRLQLWWPGGCNNGEDVDDVDVDDDVVDVDDVDIYIMMNCLCMSVTKIITSHFRAERWWREVSSPLGRLWPNDDDGNDADDGDDSNDNDDEDRVCRRSSSS